MKTRFEWEPTKDRANQGKHGVAFVKAQLAFAVPKRVIAGGPVPQLEGKTLLLLRVGRRRNPDGSLHVPRRRDPNLRGRLLAKGQANL
jgi:hypothetical protein